MSLIHRSRCLGLLAVVCVAGSGPSHADQADGEDVVAVREALKAHRDRLLRLEGGWSMHYRMTVEQDPTLGDFAFSEVDGYVTVRWPQVYSRIRAKPFIPQGTRLRLSRQDYQREGVFNFEKNTSVARSGNEVHITPYRHVWTAKHLFPLSLQHFEQCSQFYTPEGDWTDLSDEAELWLPAALSRFEFQHAGEEQIDGIACVVLQRPGRDRLWISPTHSYLVIKREVTFGPDGPLRERTVSSDLRRIAGDLWWPFRQMQDVYFGPDAGEHAGALRRHVELEVLEFKPGGVRDADLEVNIPNGAKVDDQILNAMYVGGDDPQADAVDEGLKHAREVLPAGAGGRNVGLIIWINVALLLAVVVLFVWYKLR